MTVTQEEIPELPESFLWKGLRFVKEPPHEKEAARYQCEQAPFYGALIRLETSGQWVAAFTNGVCAREYDIDQALMIAMRKYVRHLHDRIYDCELVLREPT